MKFSSCPYCTYMTDIKCNLLRHINTKHKNCVLDNNCQSKKESKKNNNLICDKCNKIYKTKRHLENHTQKCKGIDELTCPRCMISFTNRHNKARHIKVNNCKARSIIYAREPNPQNIQINNIHTLNHNIHHNIYINNFGNERIDHISHKEILKILMSGVNTIPMYIEKKHFDKNFPENNNIIYTKENKCNEMENNHCREKDITILSSKLIKENTQILLLYCDKNEIQLTDEIMNDELFENIKDKLFIIYNKTDNEKYNHIISLIKEVVKSSCVI